MVLEKIYSGASFQGSSNNLPSEEVCKRLESVLNGGSPLLSLGIWIWCFSAKSIKSFREFNSHSRHGAITFILGSFA